MDEESEASGGNALSNPCNPPQLPNMCLCLFRSELLSLLKTYNCYHEGRSFQLRHHEVRPKLFGF